MHRIFLLLLIIFSSIEAYAQNPVKETEFIIVIDPGHGGKDSGSVNKNALEKDIVLDYALALKKELNKYSQYKVILTRDKDKSLSLEKRKDIANKAKANIYISLHTDSIDNKNISGASVYTLSKEAMNEESQTLSSKKNKHSILKNENLLKENKEIADVIIGIVYQDTQNSSIKLAKVTSEILSQEIKMLNKHQRVGSFKVLKGVDIPGILVEIGYLSNENDFQNLQNKTYQKVFVRSMSKAINQYFLENKQRRM